MKKILVCFKIVLALLLILLLNGCYPVSKKEYFTDANTYDAIWDLSGFKHGYENDNLFFPKSIIDLEVDEYFCRYDQQFPLGEGVQLYLKIHYKDNQSFASEVKRIVSISFSCDAYFEECSFSAYATRLGEAFSMEYALIDDEQQTIYYIYLQNMPKEEVEFETIFLPSAYSGYSELAE